MNANEIVKNIIPDGINQSQKSIWERLQLPDFDEPNPKENFVLYSTPEEWLDSEIYKLTFENHYFEKEYYSSKSMMTEETYSGTDFSRSFKAYVPDYYEYKRKWNIDHQKITEIEKSRYELNLLINQELHNFTELKSLNLSTRTQSTLESINPNDSTSFKIGGFGTYSRYYNNYTQFWEKSRTQEGKQNVLYECERWWSFHLRGDFYVGNIIELRNKAKELEQNYFVSWKQILENQQQLVQEWEIKCKNHQEKQINRKKELEDIRIGYLRKNPNSIISLCLEVLKCSDYNFEFEKNIEIDFNPDTKLLIVEYTLQIIENLPDIKETKYLSSRREFKNVLLSQNELLKLFDEVVYSITLRSIYEIFISDAINTVSAINFNGWIRSINKAIGKEENTCIVSIQTQRKDFLDIELLKVEPKACFKFFKGVGSSKLYGITAIQPILQIQKYDKRFVSSHSVEFENSTNLALMDWEDFEHLIRELFEKEFSSNGGEVRVTQVSRDGGVDAVAFDPDPIRGGKIVIQAKRYTNTVGVSAVRDLYGTVLNEGATKGILVTTSDYGSDSYEFAKGKPLTLLNGANLLYLLEKHGTRAKIDIKEAKRIMCENK